MQNSLNQSFPFFLNEHGKNTILILLISAFISLFLILYIPFENVPSPVFVNVGWGLLVFIVLYANIILLPRLFPLMFDLTRWTLGKYLLFNLWLFALMGILFSAVNATFFCGDMQFVNVMIKTQREVVLTGLIPLFVVTVLARNNLLRQNLADAFLANKRLVEIQHIKDSPGSTDHHTTIHTDTNETFAFNLTDLLYVVAADNYAEIFWLEKGLLSKRLLRITLKNVERQLTNQFIVRPHRSYLINVQAIESISGNTNGYKIKMKNADIDIPVSRTKGKEIITHIQQTRDLLDIW